MENFEHNKNNGESFENMQKQSLEHAQELREQYPTIESLVDDYRKGIVDAGMMKMRFPDKADQEEVLRIAEERNEADSKS